MKIELSSGKVLELTKDEWSELMSWRKVKKSDKVEKVNQKPEPVDKPSGKTEKDIPVDPSLKWLDDLLEQISKYDDTKSTSDNKKPWKKSDEPGAKWSKKGYTEIFPGMWLKVVH